MDYKLTNVLSTDGLDKNGIRLLQDSGIEVVEEKFTKTQLIEKLPDFDAIIVRSATMMDGEIIRAVCSVSGNKLKVIARAGTGVDNIDMDAATECGLLVLNTPAANTMSAAEHTFALMCCLSRCIPQAYMTMQQNKWDRKSFMGTELFGKTLAIVGLGRIGREVASRAQAFGMKTIGYDPIVSYEEAASFKVEAMTLNEIWPLADYITVHVPLIPQTENLINLEVLKKCKTTVQVINCSRGGIINEKDLLTALKAGLCSGAAIDVFTEEPPTCTELITHPKVISTPHLGASTKEAQFRVAMEVAENLLAVSNGSRFNGLVNGHTINLQQNKESDLWCLLLSMISKGLRENKKIDMFYDDGTQMTKQRGFEDFLKGSLITLLLRDAGNVNLINWNMFARKQEIQINVSKRDPSNLSISSPSLGVQINNSLLEISVWNNQVYLTKFNNQVLEQPCLLKTGCNFLLTNNHIAPIKLLADAPTTVISYNVNETLHVIVTRGTLDKGLLNDFEFTMSL